MNQIKYTIKQGKLTESGTVDTIQELYNRIKAWPEFEKLQAERVKVKHAGKLQKDKL